MAITRRHDLLQNAATRAARASPVVMTSNPYARSATDWLCASHSPSSASAQGHVPAMPTMAVVPSQIEELAHDSSLKTDPPRAQVQRR